MLSPGLQQHPWDVQAREIISQRQPETFRLFQQFVLMPLLVQAEEAVDERLRLARFADRIASEREAVDLVLTDLVMPEQEGLETIREALGTPEEGRVLEVTFPRMRRVFRGCGSPGTPAGPSAPRGRPTLSRSP
jgi:hypothetical protein